MKSALTFEEMKARYPGGWLLVNEPELSDTFEVVSGEVLAHSPSREEIYRQLACVQGKRISIEYAGRIAADLAVAL